MRISDWSSDVCSSDLILVDVRLDRDIFLDRGAARQGLALVALEIHERETGCVAMVDLSVHDLHLAGRTQAVAARMRELDAGAECGIGDGLRSEEHTSELHSIIPRSSHDSGLNNKK